MYVTEELSTMAQPRLQVEGRVGQILLFSKTGRGILRVRLEGASQVPLDK